MPGLDMRVFSDIYREWQAAPHGERGAVLARRLPLLGISEATFHRRRVKFFGAGGRKIPATKGVPKKPEYLDTVKAIVKVKHSNIRGVRSLTTEDAMVRAAAAGVPGALEIPVGTVNRLIREHQLHPKTQRRENRFEAARPNQIHQMDASRSEYFQCHRFIDNQWTLKLSPTLFRNRDYKAKRDRVWVWGLVDDFSGLRVMKYYIARGENPLDGIDFLQWAWSRVPEHAPFRGLPEMLYLDKGPLDKTHAFQHFCREVAKVEIKSHEAGRPQATGKVETGWKDLWNRFEAQFFRDPHWEQREFSLAELNQELAWYLTEQHNQRQHRRLAMSKEAAWLTVKGVCDIEPEAWGHIFHRDFRTLDAAGCGDFRGETFQVKEIPYPGGVRVEVLLGMRDGSLQVIDPRDGKKYGAEPFAPRLAGEFRSGERTPLEQLLAEEPMALPPMTFEPSEASKVVHLVRQGEVRGAPADAPAPVALPARDLTLAELAQGVEVMECDTASHGVTSEPLFASEWERHEFLVGKKARGEALTPEEEAFEARFYEDYAETLALLGAEPSRKAALAVVE